MAISLEELALGALEGSAGPWTLAVGAGALAMMLAAGSARPVRRMAATGVVAAQRNGQLQLPGSVSMSITSWLGSVRQSWRDLVAEARAEYEAGRKPAPLALDAGVPVVLKPEDRAEDSSDAPPALVVSAATAPPPAHDLDMPEDSADQDDGVQAEGSAHLAETSDTPENEDESSAPPRRDRRGRFVRRKPTAADASTAPHNNNGTRSE